MSDQTKETDKRLFYKINISQRLLLKHVDRESTNRLGVPLIQVTALLYLIKNDGCQLNDLSAVLMQNKSAITTLVGRLEKNDLIVRKKSEADGRASNLFLTDKGHKVGIQALPMMKEFNLELLNKFSDSEIEIIHRFVDTIIENYR